MARYNIRQLKYVDAAKDAAQRLVSERVFKSIAVKLLRSWVLQGSLYMAWRELIFRYVLEAFFVVAIFYGLLFFSPLQTASAAPMSFITAHTLFWCFNGHVWAISIGDKRRLAKNTPGSILSYLGKLYIRMNDVGSVKGCVVFGSLARGEFTENSDLDIVCCRKPGLVNSILAYSVGIRERAIAFLNVIPVEIYFYDMPEFEHLDENERPLLVKDVDGEISKIVKLAIPYADYRFDGQSFFRKTSR